MTVKSHNKCSEDSDFSLRWTKKLQTWMFLQRGYKLNKEQMFHPAAQKICPVTTVLRRDWCHNSVSDQSHGVK